MSSIPVTAPGKGGHEERDCAGSYCIEDPEEAKAREQPKMETEVSSLKSLREESRRDGKQRRCQWAC